MKDLESVQAELEADGCVVYKADEFRQLNKSGWLTPWDGYGYLHNGEWETDIDVWDKSEWDDKVYPYVCWYNK